MKIEIERHTYAPELNAVFLRGRLIKGIDFSFLASIPRHECIAAVRAKIFKQVKPARLARLSSVYANKHLSEYNRTRTGVVGVYSDVLAVKKEMIKYHNPPV